MRSIQKKEKKKKKVPQPYRTDPNVLPQGNAWLNPLRNSFQFNEENFLQTYGTAMGTKMAVSRSFISFCHNVPPSI